MHIYKNYIFEISILRQYLSVSISILVFNCHFYFSHIKATICIGCCLKFSCNKFTNNYIKRYVCPITTMLIDIFLIKYLTTYLMLIKYFSVFNLIHSFFILYLGIPIFALKSGEKLPDLCITYLSIYSIIMA
jgi:hypothetical protein